MTQTDHYIISLHLKIFFQAGYSVTGSLGMVGQHVLMLRGSPGVCPVEPDCLTAPALWRK